MSDNDGYKAEELTKKNFPAMWEEHDIMKNGFIDKGEAYTLMQDVNAGL